MSKDEHGNQYLLRQWRRVVLIRHHHRCVICGNMDPVFLDCHHIIHRRDMLLEYDPENGVPVCRQTNSYSRALIGPITCHDYADTARGRIYVAKHVDSVYLLQMHQHSFKDYLDKMGLTHREFLDQMSKRLTEEINEYEKRRHGE